MRLLLINPRNPLVSMGSKRDPWSKYRVWKPLGLMAVAGLTPAGWDISIVDENLGVPDYEAMPRPDLVGMSAFTSQAPRTYELAAQFQDLGIPVVMGGIHATMRPAEASGRMDAVVTGEAESIWPEVLDDFRSGRLKKVYEGTLQPMGKKPLPRHDLLPSGYYYGSIQTTRGCPLNCSFCSVSAFNGKTYRARPIEEVVEEFRQIRERHILVVDDNLIGTRKEHIVRAKELFRAMISADLGKRWFSQATINMADDEELLELAARAGCTGVFIGFETPKPEGLVEVRKLYNLRNSRDFRASVRRIQKHNILVAGSFIMGLDIDHPGIGLEIASTAREYGVDAINTMYLTPLPGTALWDRMEADGLIRLNRFPEDWKYYTLTIPVCSYRHFSHDQIVDEMHDCNSSFYSLAGIMRRAARVFFKGHRTILSLVCNLSYRKNAELGWRYLEDIRR
ncbi:MAG TPA: radical SAM protein, partial [Candidatus Krumholzibacterium sp.]|nr:radical SAM protein [Candidatus Krumholzibacterium sp.]